MSGSQRVISLSHRWRFRSPTNCFWDQKKEIEDARYLWEIFKDNLDRDCLKSMMKQFVVRGDDYGIIL
jgi:hypothetical protein